tara:strand:- start:808 stop:1590 length:783 start_codon:yes stop_codon:yes gene_type:complete
MDKFLLLITGETYRHGPQMTRDRGGEESYKRQMLATESHINFAKFMKLKYDLDCDIICNFYTLSDDYDKHLSEKYSNYSIFTNFNSSLLGELNAINQSIKFAKDNNLNNYKFVLSIRPDHYLKEYFNFIFNPYSDKVLFSFVSIPNSASPDDCMSATSNSIVHIDNNIWFVPYKYYSKLSAHKIYYAHNSYNLCRLNDVDVDVMIDTLHSSSTDLTWNPLFHQVGRKENTYENWKPLSKYYFDNDERKVFSSTNESNKYT